MLRLPIASASGRAGFNPALLRMLRRVREENSTLAGRLHCLGDSLCTGAAGQGQEVPRREMVSVLCPVGRTGLARIDVKASSAHLRLPSDSFRCRTILRESASASRKISSPSSDISTPRRAASSRRASRSSSSVWITSRTGFASVAISAVIPRGAFHAEQSPHKKIVGSLPLLIN